MAVDWERRLLAYLHDPPDKALGIRGHVERACRYATEVLSRPVHWDDLEKLSDVLASVAERLPAPSWTSLTVNPDQGRLRVCHPLSGKERWLETLPVDEEGMIQEIRSVLQGLGDDRQVRLLALWRLLPEYLAEEHAWFSHLPADTRIPDHTIWHHLDTTTALQAADETNRGAAFLSFSLGPVQTFITTARSVRDLWSGSMILSWLTFQAMVPIIEKYGPMAFVFPHLRGIPFLDRWLERRHAIAAGSGGQEEDLQRAPCLPNRFLALVPWGPQGELAREAARQCREAVREKWQELAQAVRDGLKRRFDPLEAGWDRRWDEQIDHFWEIQTAVLPWREVTDEVAGKLLTPSGSFADAFPDADAVRGLAKAIPSEQEPGYDQGHAGRWQARVELSARLMQAQRAVRHIPPSTADEEVPPKCSLMGSYEQMGPAQLEDSRRFWEGDPSKQQEGASHAGELHGVRLRKGERFCAVALVKRFSGPAFLARELDLEPDDLRFPDTATIAACEWLGQAGIDPDAERRRHRTWNGQWLHWPTQHFDPDEKRCPDDVWSTIQRGKSQHGRPPAYYAILMMDADHMGQWLAGKKSPPVRTVLHSQLVSYFQELGDNASKGLNKRRPLGPALHAALSEALSSFALHFVPPIVRKHKGTLIYAGGDDVLALVPTSKALQCAFTLRQTFQQNWARDEQGRERLLPGETATVSAGIAVVHYKEDLRFALNQARQAEKAAKDAGRDALQLAVCRRSGEHSTAPCPWDFVPSVMKWVDAFLQGASDRWAYHLAAELPTLVGLNVAAMRAEVRRQVNRAEEATRRDLGETREERAGDVLAGQLDCYRSPRNDRPPMEDGKALASFVTLCQSASFLARGREE